VCSNKSPLGPYRGVGRSGACFAIETLIDEVARTVGRHPEEVRLDNLVRPEQMPYKSSTHKLYDSGDYPEALRRAIQAVGADAIRQRQSRGEADGRLIGLGFGCYTEQTAHGTAEWVARGLPVAFGYEPALARFTPDGELVLYVGIQNHGQGLETTLAQVAHQELSIRVDCVTVRHGDSSVSPYGMGTFASRSMTMAGGAVSEACRQLADKIRRIGAHMLGERESAVRLIDGGVRGEKAAVPFARIADAAYLHPNRLPEGEEPGLEAFAVYQPGRSTGAFSYASHACVVAVDPDTGVVEILDYVVVHDCGTMVNPMIVEAQVTGGVAQGLGTALYEEIPYDENAQPLASTFLDYMLPGATEVPDVRVLHMESPSPHTRLGIKGLGEGGAIAPPAAVVNAVNDALKGLGARIEETPVTPERVVDAVLRARAVPKQGPVQ
jgi:carbon-monoxide dehydrogenase large subunit